MAKIRVSPKEPNPTHHVGLTGSDGKTVGLVLTDAAGNPDPTGIASQPFPRTAIKTYSGTSDLDSEEPPFNPISQRDWSGGMGKLVQDEAANRYREAHGVNTSYPNVAFLQGQEEHMLGYRAQNSYDPDSVTFMNDPFYPYHAISFVPTENYSAKFAQVYVKREGLPTTGTVQFHIYTDAPGEPGTLLASSGYVNVSSISTWAEEKDEMMISISSSFSSPPALTAGTTYWLKVDWPGADTNGVITLAYDTNNKTGALKSATGAVWLTNAEAFYYNIRADGPSFDAIFIKYKGCDYMITQNADKTTASDLYISGARGMADSNAGNLDKVIDATAAWTTNAFVGGYAVIRKGTSAREERPFRKITANSATQITCDKNWVLTHDTNTQYIIVGTKQWTKVGTFSGYVSGATVAAGAIYVVGPSTKQYYIWEESPAGTERIVGPSNAGYGSNDWILTLPVTPVEGAHSEMLVHGTLRNTFGNTQFSYPPTGWPGQVAGGDIQSLVKRIDAYLTTEKQSWSEQTIANVTTSIDYDAAVINIAAGFTTGNVASWKIPTTSFMEGDRLVFEMQSDISLAAGDYQIVMSDTAALGGSQQTFLNIPAITTTNWTQVLIDFEPQHTGGTKDMAVISFGLKRINNVGANLLKFTRIWLAKTTPNYVPWNPPSQQKNSVVTYSGSLDGSNTINPWSFDDEGNVYEWQRQNGQISAKLVISSGATQSGPYFGSAAVQHGLYLYFNVGTRLQRYYNNQIDDVGPDRDDGLPDLQKGAIPYSLVSYAGRLYASYYTGSTLYQSDATGHHAIYVEQNNGWCEVTRNLYGGAAPIRSIGTQATPVQRKYIMWVVGGLVMRAAISFDPLRDADYKFRPDGVIITGRYYAGRRDIEKFFKAVKVTADNLEGIYDTNNVKITLWYRTDIQTAWTQLPDAFDYSPFKQVDLNNLMDATGRWIQFRIMLETDQSTISPILYGIVIETMIRVPVKDAYTITFKLANNDTDLQGNFEDADAKAKYDILREWLAGAKPIKLSTLDELTHGLTVYPEPIPIRKILRTYEEGGQVKTKWVCQMSLLEI